MLRKESFRDIRIMFSFININVVNTISIYNFFWVCLCAFTLALFIHLPLLLIGDRIIMLHDVDLLHIYPEIDGITTLGFSARYGFVFFVWLLHGVLLRVFLEYFTLLRGVYGDMQQACVSCNYHIIA